MMVLKINGKDYKVKFGYNCFCDSDVLDRTMALSTIGQSDANKLAKEIFCVTRELLFLGFKKYNPVDSVQDVGDLLDDYYDENPDDESRGLIAIFEKLTEELTKEGFLGGMLGKMNAPAKRK